MIVTNGFPLTLPADLSDSPEPLELGGLLLLLPLPLPPPVIPITAATSSSIGENCWFELEDRVIEEEVG